MTRPQHRSQGAYLASLALLLVAGTALAQDAPTIESVRIGLPSGRGGPDQGRSRNGIWTPVAISVKAGAKNATPGEYRLKVESVDGEELKYHYIVDVPLMAAGARQTVTAYTVPGSDNAAFNVRLETKEGRLVTQQANLARDPGGLVRDDDVLFLTLGAGLAQMKRAAERQDKPEKGAVEQPSRQFAFISDDPSAMPDKWFGYAGVDAAVLATSNRDFVLKLLQEREKCNALREWVMRGGQVVVSVGRNRQEAASLLTGKDARLPLIPFEIIGGEELASMPALSVQWSRQGAHKAALQGLEVAAIVPGPGVISLVRDGERAVILQGACGLGRVILVAFDLDATKFAAWEGQEAFWKRMQEELAPPLSRRKANNQPAPGLPGEDDDRRNDLRADLRAGLEKFEDVTPIPFGWVALFILFYIALVGPLDYFVLKKLFKRLEWTWITFPVTVIVVSVVAYFAAYTIKGDEQRVNKVDLIDIDLHEGGQVHGNTWMTLFSPRVQACTVGLSPAGGAWAGTAKGNPGPTFSLMEVGGDRPRTGTQGLFNRPYEYAADAQGMLRVPVPVWSTRSFVAQWSAPQPKTRAIGIEDEFGPPRAFKEGRGISGKITNNLGTELLDCTLIYKERWYTLGKLAPGESKRLDPLFALDAQGQNRDIPAWFNGPTLAPGLPLAPSGQRINANFQLGRSAYRAVKQAMFFRAADVAGNNVGLRMLDQTWRLRALPIAPAPKETRWRDEAILVARAPMLSDRADVVGEHPASPSRLWVGRLPETGAEPPELPGFITQETYIRIYIPIR